MEKTGNYELLYIVHPDLESSIDKISDRVRSYIKKRDGKITYEEDWGKKKLAYGIKGADVGLYLLWYFDAPKKAVSKIERDLRLTEEVIRYLVLSVDEEKTAKKKKPKASPEAAEKPKKPAAKKEDESARMKKVDEKLGELLGEEENKKESKGGSNERS